MVSRSDKDPTQMMETIDRLISFESFNSMWYWVFLGLAWSSRTHWTIGIPFDSIMRADKYGDEWEADVDRIAAASARRFALLRGTVAVVITSVITFLMAMMATAAFAFNNEFSQALFALALPMLVAEIGDIRLAQRINHTGLRGYALRRKVVWRRFLNQATGMVSLLMATSFAIFNFLFESGYIALP